MSKSVAIKDLVEGLRLWELWVRLCTSEVRRRYKRTLLGPMWVAISLGAFATALSIVWSALWKQDVQVYLPFVLSGLIPWTMFASSLAESCMAFVSGESSMKARQFPYTILIHVVVGRNAIIFGHNLITYLLAALICTVPLSWYMIMVIPGFLLLVINLSWISLLTAILCLRYRDLQQLVTILLQTAMFITPLFWPPESLGGRAQILVDANVLYHMIDVVRSPLLGKPVALHSYLVTIGLAIVGWVGTLWLYERKRQRLVYWM